MGAIALIPGLLSAWVTLTRSPARAFLNVYLPTLLLLPDYYRFVIAGLPDPSFHHAAVIPIVAVFVLRQARQWTVSATDLLVLVYAFAVCYSEYRASNWADAQNLLVDVMTAVLCPYVLAKGLVEPLGLRVAFARRMAGLIFAVAAASLFEFRFGRTPWMVVLGPFFPGQGGWVTTLRWGFARIAGPYGHAIICGMVLGYAFQLHRWLLRWGYWGRPGRGRLVTAGLIAGMVMTMSRGPWIGTALGSLPIAIGWARNRKLALALTLAVGVFVGVPAYMSFKAYVSVGREGAASSTQETAAYRKELIDKYVDIGLEQAAWGWGLNRWPPVPGMPSIDNHYLLLFLNHGVVALGSFLLIFGWVGARLALRGASAPPSSPGGSLAFALLAAYFGMAVSITTVYLGAQSVQLLFLLTGWSESLVLRGVEMPGSGRAPAPPAPAFRFARVLT